MSKSLGNVFGIREVTNAVSAEALRLFLVATHYRSPMDFSIAAVEESFRALVRLYETLARADAAVPGRAATSGPLLPAGPRLEPFVESMDDDLNTAGAVAVLFELARELNRLLDAGELARAAEVRADIGRIAPVLGIAERPPEEFLEVERTRAVAQAGLTRAEIERQIGERAEARQAKDWRKADEIRNRLLEHGIALEDGAGATTWRPVSWGLEPPAKRKKPA
jgi:cysteinyl-tRNA synthetase